MTIVQVSTPSRLHFGLLRLHEDAGRSFGGLGMMIDQPRVELEMTAAAEWRVKGRGAARAERFAARALAAAPAIVRPAALDIRLQTIVPQHRGLGGGTQLALAVAAGVRELVGLAPGTAAELAAAVGRGARSAVGSHGFVHGGVIWELGHTSGSPLGEMSERVAAPVSWRIVLATPPRRRGLSGAPERAAFESLPPVPAEVTHRLESIATEQILPAARAGVVEDFGDGVYEYGRLSGACFANVQGGPYASPEIAECVTAIRATGVRGVGQSSWGPTVYAITGGREQSEELVARLRGDARWAEFGIQVAAPDNLGAVVRREACGAQHEAATRTARRSS